ncbi:MAG: phospholipase D-like domain-containing protein [Lentimicrobium sp.]
MKTYQTQISLQCQILGLLDSSNSNIKIAVSWFTDEAILNKLISKADAVKVEVLTSADEMNLLRHDHFRRLKFAGATVKKIGSSSPLDGDFMHSKFMIVDDAIAYGGSYNFTTNARSNYETFKQWDRSELRETINEFNNWMSNGVDFFAGIANAEEVVRKLKEKFLEEQRRNDRLIRDFGAMKFSEEQYTKKREEEVRVLQSNQVRAASIISNNKSKETSIRETAKSISNQESGITSAGAIVSGGSTVARPHSFHGGSAVENVAHKKKNYYALTCYQKYHIDNHYSCFKTSIVKGKLVCSGVIQPTPDCEKYKVRIEFYPGHQPHVYVKSPEISPSSEIHVYREGFLCLFDPRETKWKDTLKIAEYTIPWTIEWILYYELWKITGKWEGKESIH